MNIQHSMVAEQAAPDTTVTVETLAKSTSWIPYSAIWSMSVVRL
jgi:hypothetical protein